MGKKIQSRISAPICVEYEESLHRPAWSVEDFMVDLSFLKFDEPEEVFYVPVEYCLYQGGFVPSEATRPIMLTFPQYVSEHKRLFGEPKRKSRRIGWSWANEYSEYEQSYKAALEHRWKKECKKGEREMRLAKFRALRE